MFCEYGPRFELNNGQRNELLFINVISLVIKKTIKTLLLTTINLINLFFL